MRSLEIQVLCMVTLAAMYRNPGHKACRVRQTSAQRWLARQANRICVKDTFFWKLEASGCQKTGYGTIAEVGACNLSSYFISII